MGSIDAEQAHDPLRFGAADAETARRYDPAALASPSAPAPPSHTFAGPLGTASAMVDIPLVSPSPSTYHAPSAPLLPPAQPPTPHTSTAASHTSQPPPPMPSYPAVPSAVGALTPPSAPYWPTPSPSSGPAGPGFTPAGPGFGPAGPGGGFAGSSSGFPHSLSALDGPPSTLKGPTYHISVGQPVKVAGPPPLPGLDGHYIVFPISSTSVGPAGYPGPEGQVRRRFKDVVSLSELLAALFPGQVLPPRPRRNALEGRRMHVRFLEDRRQALERYLHRLASHPAVRRSEALRVFLHEEGELRSSSTWRRLLPSAPSGKGVLQETSSLLMSMVGQAPPTSAHDVVASASAPRTTFKALSERVASLRAGAALRAAPVSPLEQQLRDEGSKVSEVQRLLGQLALRAATLRSRSEAHSAALGDLSHAIFGLGTYQESMGFAPGRAEAALSDGCMRVSKLLALASEHSARQLSQVDDYVSYMPGVQAALQHRGSALMLQLQLEQDLARRTGRLNVIMATAGQFAKQQQLEGEVAVLRGAVEAARSEYYKASEQNASDLAALRRGMSRDMVDMLREFALVQVASAQKAEQLWRDTLQAMG